MSSFAPEDAENERTSTLSPFSPKPLHFPAPSNIPLLENQMDTTLEDPAQKPGQQQDNKPAVDPSDQDTPSVPTEAGPPDGTSQDASSTSDARGLSSSHQSAETALSAPQEPLTLNPQDPQTQDVAPAHNEAALNDPTVNDAQLSANQDEQTALSQNVPDTQNGTSTQVQSVQPQDPQTLDQAIMKTAEDKPDPINIQALLDNLSAAAVIHTPASNKDSTQLPPNDETLGDDQAVKSVDAQATASTTHDAPSFAANGANLPPRPPTQTTLGGPGNATNGQATYDIQQNSWNDQSSNSYQHQAQSLPPLYTGGAPGTSSAPNNGLGPPPSATFSQDQGLPPTPSNLQQPESDTPALYQPDPNKAEEAMPWDAETQRLYDQFLSDERRYVMEGNWERFPANSRLFIGNLPSEKVTKRDLFHIFHRHGKLAQISIKAAYGFVQYLDGEHCLAALQKEQGVAIRGRKIHLEVSKPQRNTRNARQRSRSPDRQGQRGDRYRGPPSRSGFSRGDDRRYGRSPSPRARDRRGRSPEYYDGQRRSRSPYGRNQGRSSGSGDEMPFPRRSGPAVPVVQIVAREEPDRNFLSWVEQAFKARGLACDVRMIGPRLDDSAVMRHFLIEGVFAVLKVDRRSVSTQRFDLTFFNRNAGDNVKIDTYNDIQLHVCVELVNRDKPPTQYGMQPSQFPQAPPIPPPQMSPIGQAPSPFPPNLNQMDPNALQQLLALTQQQQSPTSAQFPSAQQPSNTDVSRLLAQLSQSQQPQQQQQFQNLAGLLANQQQGQGAQRQGLMPPLPQQQQQGRQSTSHQQQGQSAQNLDMQNVLAQLSRYQS